MKVNNKEYPTPVLNFSNMTKMENQGLTVSNLSDRPLTFLAAFVALAMDADLTAAQEEIDAHLSNGGSLDEITDELNMAVDESGFFKAGKRPA